MIQEINKWCAEIACNLSLYNTQGDVETLAKHNKWVPVPFAELIYDETAHFIKDISQYYFKYFYR